MEFGEEKSFFLLLFNLYNVKTNSLKEAKMKRDTTNHNQKSGKESTKDKRWNNLNPAESSDESISSDESMDQGTSNSKGSTYDESFNKKALDSESGVDSTLGQAERYKNRNSELNPSPKKDMASDAGFKEGRVPEIDDEDDFVSGSDETIDDEEDDKV